MRTTLFALLLLAAGSVGRAFAQTEFPLLADQPDPKYGDALATFGRLVGAWTFEGGEFGEDGKRTVADKGELHFHWILAGRAIQDVWMETERSDGVAPVLGTTVRFYDPKTDTWRATWVEPNLGAMRAITGRRVGEDIVFDGTSSNGTAFRWIFSEIEPDSFHWHAERLIGGQWRLYEDLRARRKRSAARLAFERLSALAGDWKAVGKEVTLKYTLTADGSALMEELRPANQPPMITMFSVDRDRLVATHYCSAGNQPQMATAPLANADAPLAFWLERITGMTSPGDWHNTGLEIRFADGDHLVQTWKWEEQGKPGTTVLELERVRD